MLVSRMASETSVTVLLQQFAAGEKSAFDRLVPLVYSELQRLAGGYLRNERPDHTLQPTALVHEVYARLVQQEQPDYASRAHFLGVAAHIMRQILIDHARSRSAAKRKVELADFPLDAAPEVQPSIVAAIDDALQTLQQLDPLKARLIEMRFFGGMTAEESAASLNLPVEQVRRKLRVAQAWLKAELDHTGSAQADS